MADSTNGPSYPPYPPYPPFPPYPPYAPIVIVIPCCHCGAGTTPVSGQGTQPGTQAGTQPGTQSGTQPGTPVGGGAQGGTTNQFNSLAFTITPGTPQGVLDVVGGGTLTADLFLAGSSSSPFQSITLRSDTDPFWLTTQNVTIGLNTAVSSNALGSVKINFIPGELEGTTFVIASIQVVLSNSGGTPAPVMLLNRSGDSNNPVAILSGSNASITFPF